MTQKVGLIGYPLGHSISPVFQQAAFNHLGLDIRYELWETKPEDLQAAVQRIRSEDILGANVTVPYKEDVLKLLDGLDSLAADIGAVNTIVKKGSQLIGYNTDAGGFLRALKDQGKFDPQGKTVVIIGAGGVARAISFVLIKSGVRSLTLFDIEKERAQKLASALKTKHVAVLASNTGAEYEHAVSSADLLINCTPIGMKHSASEARSPVAENVISAKSLVYDVVYNPPMTPLLKGAEKAGARTLGGLSMLVYQGIAAFELWTGRKAPVDIMLKRAEEAL